MGHILRHSYLLSLVPLSMSIYRRSLSQTQCIVTNGSWRVHTLVVWKVLHLLGPNIRRATTLGRVLEIPQIHRMTATHR